MTQRIDKKIHKESHGQGAAKAVYISPELTVLGTLANLIRGGSAGAPDGNGNGDPNG